MGIAVVLHVLDTGEELACETSNLLVVKWRIFDVVKHIAHWSEFLHCVYHLAKLPRSLRVLAIIADADQLDDISVGRDCLERPQFSHQVLHLACPLARIF